MHPIHGEMTIPGLESIEAARTVATAPRRMRSEAAQSREGQIARR